MKRYVLTLAIITFCFNSIFATNDSLLTTIANHKSFHTTMYVWAPSGLNLRAAPSTNSEIIKSIPFGDSLNVIEKLDKSYTVKIADTVGIPDYQKRFASPYFIHGQWVKVLLDTGQEAFVIDNYLLDFKPKKVKDLNRFGFDYLEITKIDSIIKDRIAPDYTTLTKVYFQEPITLEITGTEKGNSFKFETSDLSFDEIMVIINTSLDPSKLIVTKNWPNTIEFNINHYCYFVVTIDGEHITVEGGCSC